MADDNHKVKIDLDVSTTGEDTVNSLIRSLDKLASKQKTIDASLRSIGKPQSPGGKDPTKEASAAETVKARGRRAKKSSEDQSVRSAQTLNAFDKASVALFKTKLASQTKAATESLRAERQSFANFRTRNAAQSRYESAQVRALRDRMTAEARIGRMRSSAENDAISALKTRLSTQNRAYRQRVSEERAVQREQARSIAETARAEATRMREHASAIRSNARLEATEARRVDRERSSARRTVRSSSRDAMNYGQDAYHRITRPPAVAAAVGTAATVGFGRKALGAEADIDAAEINSRIYAGLSKDAARDLRDKWASPLAESLGVNTSKMITSFTDAVKLGIPTEGAKQFSELATKTSEAWGVPFENVTDILGTVNTLLTSKGEAFNYDKLKSTANTLQYLAAKQSTTPEKLMSFMQRGAGAAQVLGMSQEAGLAFGSASTSLGNQAGQSGRMFDYVASRLIEMPRLTKKKGDEGKQARDLIRSLGYSSAEDMDRNRRSSPDKFLPDFMERFSKIQNPKKQEEAIRFFTGREWMGEFGRMVKGNSTYKEAAKLAEEAKGLDAIGEVWELHRTKLSFVFKQFKAGWLNILGEFGKVLSPLARQAGDYFLDWSRKLQSGGLQARFRAAIDGFIEGFGFRDLPAMLQGMFGVPGEGEAGSIEKWKATAKAFAEGIRDVFGTIKGIASTLSGGDPEVIARWTGRILALSAALIVLSPVLSVIGGLATAILALAAAAKAGAALLRLAGIGTPATAAAGAGGATAGAVGSGAATAANAAKGGLGAGAAMGAGSGIMSKLLRLWAPFSAAKDTGLTKADQDALSLKLGKWAKEREAQKPNPAEAAPVVPNDPRPGIEGLRERVEAPIRTWSDPPARGTDAAATIQPQSYSSGDDIRSLIRKASFSAPEAVISGTVGSEAIAKPADPRREIVELTEALRENTEVHRAELEKRNGFASFNRASISGPAETVKAAVAGSSSELRAASSVMSGSTGQGTVTGGLAPLEGSTPGAPLNGGGGLSRRGIIGGGGDGGGYAPPSTSMAGKTFDAKAPGIMANLMKDLNLSKEQAAGILGNLGHESAGMTAYQEGNPRGGGRGGAGWAQWTGPRRRAFEAWSASKGLDPRSDDANYGFLKHELGTTHKGALSSLRRQNTVDGATIDFERTYEAAGVKHYGSRLGYARKAFNGPSAPSQVIGGTVGTDAASNVAANAEKLVGLGSSQAAQSLGARMTPGSWCGDFVNGALKSANIRGVNSSIANSFLTWGKEVTDGVKAGDVLVEHRGRGVGQTGGHAGIATGNTRMGPRGLQYEQVSGNYGGRVARNWENASGVIARRALEATNNAVAASKAPAATVKRSTDWNAIPSPVSGNLGGLAEKANDIKGSSWKPSDGNKASSPLTEGVEAGKPNIADSVPQAAIERATGTGGGNGGNTSNSATTNNVTINGTNMSPEEIASSVQRKLSKDMRRQTTGASPYSMI